MLVLCRRSHYIYKKSVLFLTLDVFFCRIELCNFSSFPLSFVSHYVPSFCSLPRLILFHFLCNITLNSRVNADLFSCPCSFFFSHLTQSPYIYIYIYIYIRFLVMAITRLRQQLWLLSENYFFYFLSFFYVTQISISIFYNLLHQ